MAFDSDDSLLAKSVVSTIRGDFGQGAPVAEIMDELAQVVHNHGGPDRALNAAGGLLMHLREKRPTLIQGGRFSNASYARIEHIYGGGFTEALRTAAASVDPAAWWNLA
jgi:hypothetical protein